MAHLASQRRVPAGLMAGSGSDRAAPRRPRVAGALLVVVLAGCGGDERVLPSASSTTTSPDAVARHVEDGVRAFQETDGQGVWAVARHPRGPDPVDADTLERLQALGYVDGERAVPAETGVTVYDEARASSGLNLYVDGHGAEAILIDMHGRPLHRWAYDPTELAREMGVRHHSEHVRYWFRRAHVFPNGDLLAVVDNLMLLKLDRDSNLRWVYTGRTHHDVDVTPAGEIWALTADRRRLRPLRPTGRLVDNDLVRLDGDGQELDRFSLFEAIRTGNQPELLDRLKGLFPSKIASLGDVLHVNSVEVLDGRLAHRLPAFARGNVLLSAPHIHAVMVVDPSRRAVVWSLLGRFRYQHHPTVLGNGNLLLFDNQRGPDLQSAVLELDPVTGAEVWAYRGSEQEPFFSTCCGTCYRLPNGNTLIVETEGGRAFETTPAGEIVWEFLTPHRAGKTGDLIAQLFDLVRLDPDMPTDWIQAPSG